MVRIPSERIPGGFQCLSGSSNTFAGLSSPKSDASVLESESPSLTLHGLSDIAHHPGHSECYLETWRLGFGGCILARSPLA